MLVGLALLLVGCEPEPYPGFSRHNNSLYYKLHYWGDGETTLQSGQYAKLVYEVRNGAGQLLYDSRWPGQEQPVAWDFATCQQSALGNGLLMLVEGDSATFIVPRKELDLDTVSPTATDTGQMVWVPVRITQFLSESEYLVEKKKARKREEHRKMEPTELAACLALAGLQDTNLVDGIYMQIEEPGEGPLPQAGDRVEIHYEGFFSHNEKFDSSIDRQEPLEFALGTPDQVIPGFAVALRHMRPGAKAKIVLPSQLAFGPDGSSYGIVPPYTPVVYHLELLNVRLSQP